MQIRLRSCLLLLGWCLSQAALLAQSPYPFSQKVAWETVSTDNIRVYYHRGEQEAAERVARYAEVARYELGLTLDYRPKGPHHLVYLPQQEAGLFAPFDYQDAEPDPGVFQLPQRFQVVIQPATHADLYREVKRQMARNLLREFTYGHTLNNILHKQVLFYDAKWFMEGLADFLGEGWTYQDERHLSTMTSYEWLNLAQEGSGPLHKSARKSIWYYITNEYGEQKISEIIYLVNISNSIESGIISVLGVTLNTLTDQWQQYMEALFRTQEKGRTQVATLGDAIRLPHQAGQSPRSFAFHRPSHQVAVFFEEDGEQQLWLYDLEGRSYQSTPIKSGIKRQNASRFTHASPIAWSHDGKTLATTVYQQQGYRLAFWDRPTGEVTYVDLPSEIDAIRDIAWAYHDDRLAYAVQHKGQTDIWLGKPRGKDLVPLTDDVFDDLDPVWSLDDQFLFFSSTRDSVHADPAQARWSTHQGFFDLYRFDLSDEGSRKLKAITRTPFVDERDPFPLNSYELIYQTNESGITNLGKINVFTQARSHLSNLAVGFDAYQADEKQLMVHQSLKGQAELFWLPLSSVSTRRKPAPTLLRLAYDNRYRMAAKARQKVAQLDSVEQVISPEPLAQMPQPESAELAATPPDSEPEVEPEPEVTSDDSQPVRYYIFDEETDPYEVRRPEPSRPSNRAPQRAKQQNRASKIIATVFGQEPAPQIGQIKVKRDRKPDIPWKADYLGLNLHFDPFARLGTELTLGFSDMFNEHRLQFRMIPYFSLNQFESDLRYTYGRGYIDWFGQLGISSREMRLDNPNGNSTGPDELAIYRFNQYNLQAGGRYPLSAFAHVEARLGFFQINRVDQKLEREERFDASDQLVRAGTAIRYQRVQQQDGFRTRGWQGQASFDSYYSVPEQNFAFHRIAFDAQYYRPLVSNIILALGIDGAFNLPMQVEQYYLGGVDRRVLRPIAFQNADDGVLSDPVMDTSLYRAHFMHYATPVRGFRNAVRAGSRYLMANAELRIPVSRLLKHALTSNRLYNLEIIPFFDLGAVWVSGNPFSQKKPTDTRIIPMDTKGPFAIELQTLKSPFLVGFGSGARMSLMGWSIRADLAWGVDDYTLQSPSLTFSMGKNF